MSTDTVRVRLEPLSAEIDVPRGALLSSCLTDHGIEFPCGGKGTCGGCGMRVLAGSLPISVRDRAIFSSHQLAEGWRLACQARAETPLTLECRQWHMDVLSDNSSVSGNGKHGLGIAIDLGTTTLAAQVIDMASGRVLGVETSLNPQARFGSDVMSRIKSALSGADLTTPIRQSLGKMIGELVAGRDHELAEIILVGNTVMHHLFSGLDIEPLSYAPFHTPHAEAQFFQPAELNWPLPASCRIHFARCLGGFVGSDILAGITATGMHRSDELVALVDLGTNGEIVIGNRHGIVCGSTAAGPAFEAGCICMGMRAVTGAISHVSHSAGAMKATVIGDTVPRGICGSGLVDAVAAGLESGAILASGRIADGTKRFMVSEPVFLNQADVRELQLAKAAIASGFKLLLRWLGAGTGDLECIHLAGAFGNYLQVESASAIGLIDAPGTLVHPAGNTALLGAKMMLLAVHAPDMSRIEHISLAADRCFQDEFADCIAFPERG